ncbi:MAG: hypothetical protein GY711_34350 [bacterium]|nr:hypothetical protein [bacterium]
MTRIFLTVTFAALVGIAGWWTVFLNNQINGHKRELANRDEKIVLLGDQVAERDGRIVELGVEIEQKEEEIQALEVALSFIKVDHRIARVEVLEQGEVDGEMQTKIRFVELDAEGQPMGEGREMTISGKTLYIEGLVIKFEDNYVEGGDVLRGTSICLFRRAFSENQTPEQGIELDSIGIHPLAYSGDDVPDEFYNELWGRFWDYANDPEAAAAKGVRAAHGEAPFVELRPGKTYRIDLRASDGLSIKPE